MLVRQRRAGPSTGFGSEASRRLAKRSPPIRYAGLSAFAEERRLKIRVAPGRLVVKDHELYEALVKHAQGKNVDPDAMRAAVENHPGLVRSRGEVTTLDHLRREVECILWVEAGRGKGRTFPPKGLSERLNPHQAEAMASFLRCAA